MVMRDCRKSPNKSAEKIDNKIFFEIHVCGAGGDECCERKTKPHRYFRYKNMFSSCLLKSFSIVRTLLSVIKPKIFPEAINLRWSPSVVRR